MSFQARILGGLDDIIRPRGFVFYGWWIVLCSVGIQFLSGVLWAQSTGAYMVLLQAEFGWSSTVVSLAFALTRIESGLLGPLQGWLTDRFGPRAILQIGMLLFGGGFILFSQIHSLTTFFLAFAVIAVGASLGGFPTIMVSIVSWFDQHRSKAVAMSTMGFALGGFCVPIVVAMLEGLGWRTTAIISGVLILVVGLPLSMKVLHRPEERDEIPDGVAPSPQSASDESSDRVPTRDFTAREALRAPAFWLISFGHATALLVVSAVMLHLVPHLNSGLGYSLPVAALFVSAMTGCQILGQFAGGYLGDRFDKRFICAVCMGLHAAGLLLVTYASSTLMVLAFTVLHGFAWGIRGPLMVALRADCFGSTSFGTIMGWSALIVMLGTSGGPIVAGYLRDVSGNYESGFTVLAIASLLGALFFLAIRIPDRPEQLKV